MASFWVKGDEPPGEHIPSWLPAFPDHETYAARSSEENEIINVSNGEKPEPLRVERKVEQSSLNLQEQFLVRGMEVLQVMVEMPVDQAKLLMAIPILLHLCFLIMNRKVFYNQRPLVHFKIGIGKNSSGATPAFNSPKKDLMDGPRNGQCKLAERSLQSPALKAFLSFWLNWNYIFTLCSELLKLCTILY
ncbi:hypothetical protein DITRI_Ditri16bG0105600 [Diplodiscus trichospermus]